MEFKLENGQGILFVEEENIENVTVFILTDDGEDEYSLKELINTFTFNSYRSK